MSERLQKFLARCGVASRRQCEELMLQGRVTVDGEVVREPGYRIDPKTQTVCFNGKQVEPESHVYFMLHKPPGHVCTSYDPQGRPRAIDLLPPDIGRVYTVGRLDADSEGLIIVTNDGEFAHRLSHPRFEVLKTYELTLTHPLTDQEQSKWKKGITSNEDVLKVISVQHIKSDKSVLTYRVELGEGKNRHLRRMAEESGLTVLRLKRVAIGYLTLQSLKRGECRSITAADVNKLGKPLKDDSPRNKKN